MDETTSRNDELEIALEQWSPYLITDRARPGDVLLLRGAGLLSTGIARATEGSFSHAMLLMPAGWSDLWIAAEADSLGVGTTPLMPISLQDPTSHNAIFAASIPNGPVAWQLYRHPDIESISAEALLAASKRISSREFYLSYSKLHRLVAPVPADERLKAIAETLVDFIERSMARDRSHGSFCSELIALFYEELGIGLFDEHRPAELVSPNDLAEGRSRLLPVENAFVVLADVVHWKVTKQFRDIPWERSKVLPYLVSQTHFANQISERVSNVVDIAEKARESQLNLSKVQNSQILDQMKASECQYPMALL